MIKLQGDAREARKRSDMFDKILIPLDGSKEAEAILPYIFRMAQSLNSKLTLLSVIDPEQVDMPNVLAGQGGEAMPAMPFAGVIPVAPRQESVPSGESPGAAHEMGGPYATQVFDQMESHVKGELRKVIAAMIPEGLETEIRVVFGNPAEEIVRVARKQGHDLIAMSTHGRNMLTRAILGSVTDRVLHTSAIPVLAITPEKAKQYGEGRTTLTKIVVPLDGSETAEQALPYARELAEKMSLEVIVARSVNEFPTYTPYAAALLYNDHEPMMVGIEADAAEYLKGIVKRVKASGLEARSKLLRGATAPNIIQLARDTEENMIAITTHGRSGFRRLMLGSVTEAVVRGAGDPVLVIPPKETD